MGEDITHTPPAAEYGGNGPARPSEQRERSPHTAEATAARGPRQWGADEFPDRGRGLAAERNLKIQRAYLEQLFDSAPEGIVILDPEAGSSTSIRSSPACLDGRRTSSAGDCCTK
jgi:hypothetical protein